MENRISFLSDYCRCAQFKITIPTNHVEHAQLIQKDFPFFTPERPIYSKLQIEGQSIEIQNAYIDIRDSFIKGVYYNLNRKEHSNYALILWWDFEDVFSSHEDNYLSLYDLGLLIIKCCNSIKSIVFWTLFDIFRDVCDYDRMKLVFENDRNNLLKKMTLSSWGYLVLNISHKNLKQLEKIGQRVSTRYYVQNNNPVIIKTLIELYLEVLNRFDDETFANNILQNNNYFYLDKSNVYEYIFDRITQVFYQKYSIPYKCNWDLAKGDIASYTFREFEEVLERVFSELNYSEEIDRAVSPLWPQKWKNKFDVIKSNFEESGDKQSFIKQVDELAYINEFTINIRQLFVYACKTLANIDKMYAIKYYAMACEAYDTPIPTLIGKRIKSLLFPKSSDFERFVSAFNSKDLSFYTHPECRTIKIDKESLSDRLSKHEKTAAELSELLEDKEVFDNLIDFSEKEKTETENVENKLFELFVFNEFALTNSQINTFANDYGLMPNAIIDRINENHYETFDDCIIEEKDGKWILNKDYYKQIKQ